MLDGQSEINQKVKVATALSKDGKLDEAIELLKDLILQMAKVGGYGNRGYTKIIPYFQKAGRYKEGVNYALDVIIPLAFNDAEKSFGSKCVEIKDAFKNLSISQIYGSLSSIAKLEGEKEDFEKFTQLAQFHQDEYSRLLAAGQLEQARIEYNETESLFGSDVSKWPDCFIRQFTKAGLL
jgi:hypothetical protein